MLLLLLLLLLFIFIFDLHLRSSSSSSVFIFDLHLHLHLRSSSSSSSSVFIFIFDLHLRSSSSIFIFIFIFDLHLRSSSSIFIFEGIRRQGEGRRRRVDPIRLPLRPDLLGAGGGKQKRRAPPLCDPRLSQADGREAQPRGEAGDVQLQPHTLQEPGIDVGRVRCSHRGFPRLFRDLRLCAKTRAVG